MGLISAAPPPPPGAEAFFGDRLDLVVRYAELLASDGVERGLIGPREVPRLWDRHLLNCAAVAPGLAAAARVGDLGSGAGLPGLVVALVRPDLQVTLIEPLLRRATFLAEAVAALGLPAVTVLRCRAEDHPPSAGYDVVLARAVAPLERLAGWAMPLLRPGGRLIAVKGASAPAELAAAQPALAALGAASSEVRVLAVVGTASPTTVIEVIAGARRAAAGSATAVSRETRRRAGPC